MPALSWLVVWNAYRFQVPVASLVVETATHSRYGVVVTENCWTTQRCDKVSNRIVPSPSLLVWQPPPKPDHSVLVFAGAMSTPPVLEYTAIWLLTSSVYWVGPAAPSLSGGADPLTPVPVKLAEVDGMARVAMRRVASPLVSGADTVVGLSGRVCNAGWACVGEVAGTIERSGGDVS